MINVEIKSDNLSNIIGFKVEGHANYGDYGQDIVCAAVSILSHTTLSSLVEVCGITEKQINYTIIEEDAYLDVNLKGKIDNKIFDISQIVLRTFELGVRSLVGDYPKFVTLKYRRCERCLN